MNAELIQALPKVELHCHLDGSVSMATLKKLAIKDGYPLENLQKAQAPKKCANLQAYLDSFDAVLPLLQSEENLRMAAFDLIEQVAKENVRYIEIRFAPLLHTRAGLSLAQVMTAVLKGIRLAQEQYEVRANLLVCALRHHENERNLQMVHEIAALQQAQIVGFDYAGDERDALGHRKAVVQAAKAHQLQITLHAGECGCAHHVVEAVQLGATRIGHGVAIKDDLAAIELCKAKNVLLELCPTSNLQTNAIDCIEHYPFPYFLAQELKMAINTDNRTVSNTTLTKEYQLLVTHFQLTLAQMKQLNVDAIDASFADEETKKAVKDLIEQAYH